MTTLRLYSPDGTLFMVIGPTEIGRVEVDGFTVWDLTDGELSARLKAQVPADESLGSPAYPDLLTRVIAHECEQEEPKSIRIDDDATGTHGMITNAKSVQLGSCVTEISGDFESDETSEDQNWEPVAYGYAMQAARAGKRVQAKISGEWLDVLFDSGVWCTQFDGSAFLPQHIAEWRTERKLEAIDND